MIELRWLIKTWYEPAEGMEGFMRSSKTLQLRTAILKHALAPGDTDPYLWSDWSDVPAVVEE